jgi:hypothetical protein
MRRHVAVSRTGCVTGKVRFKDKESARRALVNLRGRGPRRGKMLARCYECPSCRGWHLTSQGR